MTRASFSGATLAMILVAADSASAEGPDTQKMRAMIAGIEFITKNSSLEYAGQPLPRVTIVTEDELQLQFRVAAGQDYFADEERSFGRVSAFYDRYTNEILLSGVSPTVDPGLFHELVHFLQDVNGEVDLFVSRPVCLEAQAYELQAVWQTEHGIDPASRPDFGFVTTLNAVCNDADFSWIDSEIASGDE